MADISPRIRNLAWAVALYSFALLNCLMYLAISISKGKKENNEQSKLQLAIARDTFWNLSKQPFPQFSHHFYKLRNGLQLHYLTNAPRTQDGLRNLVVLIHGFPDSGLIWRHLLKTASGKNITDSAVVVCVDLPGYGGSDSFTQYGADEILEALTEFIIGMRTTYGTQDPQTGRDVSQTYVVGHDWGCVLAFRLASDAPSIADRFILTNGPHVELAFANKDRLVSSSSKIFKQFRQSPRTNFGCLSKSIQTMRPLLMQLLLFGYIAAFQLPKSVVKYLGTGRNFAFHRGIFEMAYRSKGRGPSEYNAGESLASSFGPGVEECKSQTQTPLGKKSETYSPSVLKRAQDPGEAFWHHTSYYRDGASYQPWNKSLQTTADLYNLENMANGSPNRRRSSSASMFGQDSKGALHAPATILWGQQDQAISQAICLDGIGDYLARNSEVILLPHSKHWTIVESEGRKALAKVIEVCVSKKDAGGDLSVGEVEKAVRQVYVDATVMVRK